MRHLATLLAALVIAPAAWILMAFGQDSTVQAVDRVGRDGTLHTGEFVRPLIVLAVAGLLLGLLGTLRFSPLGAVVTGVVYAGMYALLLVAPVGQLSMLGHRVRVAGWQADLSTPVRTGTALLVGALLLVAVASAARWRPWPRPVAADGVTEAPAEPDGPPGPEADPLPPYRERAGSEWPPDEGAHALRAAPPLRDGTARW